MGEISLALSDGLKGKQRGAIGWPLPTPGTKESAMSRSKSFLMLAVVAALTFSVVQPFSVSPLQAVPAQEVRVVEAEAVAVSPVETGVYSEDGTQFWDMLSSPVSAPVFTLVNDGGAVDLFGQVNEVAAPADFVADRVIVGGELLASL